MLLDFGTMRGRVRDACGWSARARERWREGDRTRTAHAPSTEDTRRPPSGCGNRRTRSRGTRDSRSSPSGTIFTNGGRGIGRVLDHGRGAPGHASTRAKRARRPRRKPGVRRHGVHLARHAHARVQKCSARVGAPSRNALRTDRETRARGRLGRNSKATTTSFRPSQRWSPPSPRAPLAVTLPHSRPFRARAHHRPRVMQPVTGTSADDARTKTSERTTTARPTPGSTPETHAPTTPHAVHPETSKVPVTDDERARGVRRGTQSRAARAHRARARRRRAGPERRLDASRARALRYLRDTREGQGAHVRRDARHAVADHHLRRIFRREDHRRHLVRGHRVRARGARASTATYALERQGRRAFSANRQRAGEGAGRRAAHAPHPRPGAHAREVRALPRAVRAARPKRAGRATPRSPKRARRSTRTSAASSTRRRATDAEIERWLAELAPRGPSRTRAPDALPDGMDHGVVRAALAAHHPARGVEREASRGEAEGAAEKEAIRSARAIPAPRPRSPRPRAPATACSARRRAR